MLNTCTQSQVPEGTQGSSKKKKNVNEVKLSNLTISLCFLEHVATGKPASPGPLNSSAKKQRRILETMVTSEGACGSNRGHLIIWCCVCVCVFQVSSHCPVRPCSQLPRRPGRLRGDDQEVRAGRRAPASHGRSRRRRRRRGGEEPRRAAAPAKGRWWRLRPAARSHSAESHWMTDVRLVSCLPLPSSCSSSLCTPCWRSRSTSSTGPRAPACSGSAPSSPRTTSTPSSSSSSSPTSPSSSSSASSPCWCSTSPSSPWSSAPCGCFRQVHVEAFFFLCVCFVLSFFVCFVFAVGLETRL